MSFEACDHENVVARAGECLTLTSDHAEITAIAAAHVGYELLSVMTSASRE